jgi:hypothetical protein
VTPLRRTASYLRLGRWAIPSSSSQVGLGLLDRGAIMAARYSVTIDSLVPLVVLELPASRLLVVHSSC